MNLHVNYYLDAEDENSADKFVTETQNTTPPSGSNKLSRRLSSFTPVREGRSSPHRRRDSAKLSIPSTETAAFDVSEQSGSHAMTNLSSGSDKSNDSAPVDMIVCPADEVQTLIFKINIILLVVLINCSSHFLAHSSCGTTPRRSCTRSTLKQR